MDDQSPSLITISSGKTQTNKDEIRRRLFFTARPAELTDEEVDIRHHVPGFRVFHGHSLLFLFSRLCLRLRSQWQSGVGKYWQGTDEERGEEGILSLDQKNGRFEIKVIVLLPPIAFSAQPRSRPDRPGRKMPQQVQQ